MTIRIFGDSHVGALRRGWEQLRESAGISSDPDIRFYASDGRYWLDCDIDETSTDFRISQQRPGGEALKDYVVDKGNDLYFFSSPLHSAPLYRNGVWKACCPWMCADRHDDLQALSSRVVENWAWHQVRRRIELLDRLRAGGVRIAVIEPPKPLKRTPRMFGIHADVLMAASNLYRDHVSGLLVERGILIVNTPRETYEDSGFTKSIYAPNNMKDYHHGNDAFGSLAMQEVLRVASHVAALEQGTGCATHVH